ncbi:flagellar basal body-associated protein FliL [Polynucleobacter paneuropaeus]|uniref:flagellar basal body-associated protein FliL n=1 Tax=Polynucleobacter TaxID=44013 RepID=UPI001BFCFABA|nr:MULTISPECIES: flagellar basal body-associated protein FliL [Polynucleobacter]MBT8540000.1 flagellar basal body-associated protein FliL [Polynucleobacter paneuropaeus]MBT8575292.1 flagellar basal body-associated protein FliL [Polynucleobacter paneuropaeus]MBT8623074.1 flagellar basal body-associated protein FliL [Polynucleobacter paneuropaeus]QWD11969.1 flagellar basal body-associated protein FliL [Polynucleobacter paneuropaeus]QWD17285.1 flagellar basal body-associated protein FliL [Polynuc
MAENEQAVKPKSKKMLFIILGVVLALAIGGGAAYYFLVMKADSNTAESKPKTPELQIFVPLEAFTVNLRPESTEPQQYLQTTLNLQVPSEEMSANLKSHMPELRSRILFILTNKKASEITSVEGKNTLITEITEELQKPFSGSQSEQKITGVYLTSFIIQ